MSRVDNDIKRRSQYLVDVHDTRNLLVSRVFENSSECEDILKCIMPRGIPIKIYLSSIHSSIYSLIFMIFHKIKSGYWKSLITNSSGKH